MKFTSPASSPYGALAKAVCAAEKVKVTLTTGNALSLEADNATISSGLAAMKLMAASGSNTTFYPKAALPPGELPDEEEAKEIAKALANVEMWLDWTASTLEPPVTLFDSNPAAPVGVTKAVETLEGIFVTQTFLANDHFTLADAFAATLLQSIPKFSLKSYPNVSRWLKTCKEQPCVSGKVAKAAKASVPAVAKAAPVAVADFAPSSAPTPSDSIAAPFNSSINRAVIKVESCFQYLSMLSLKCNLKSFSSNCRTF